MTIVLVVDDEMSVRSLLRDILEMEGYVVREAADGPEAMASVTERQPDLVVLDIMMPGVSGLDVLRSWRNDPALAGLPVILLTAADDDTTTWAGWTAGADCYLPKPFDPDHLLQWIERLLPDDLRPAPPVGPPGQDDPAAGNPDQAALLRELSDLADG